MNHFSDNQLLHELKNGNSRAYDALFLKYYKLLCLNAYFLLKDEEEAKELVQLFFVEFWEKKSFLSLAGEIKGYLYQAIKNRCLNHLRKRENERKRIADLQLYISEESGQEPSPSPEHLFLQMEDALAELPMQRREALHLVYLQNKKYQEAAADMGISINSLKTHLKLGLKNLRDLLTIRKEA